MNIHLYKKIKRTYIYQLSTNDLGKALNQAALMDPGKYKIIAPVNTYYFSITSEPNK